MKRKIFRALVFYALLIGLWEWVARAGIWPPYLFPSPGSVFRTLAKNIQNLLLIHALQTSLQRLVVGYLISIGLGLGIGLWMGTVRWLDETLGTLVLAFQSLPSIVWLPMALLWFGLNDRAIIFVVVMGSVFAIAVSIDAGVQNIPPLWKRAGQTLGASQWQMIRYVVLPGMLPSAVHGLKLGWSFAWRSLMAGELLFVSRGLGHLLELGRDLNDMALVIAVILVILVVGLVVDRLLFGRLEAWVNERWGLAKP